jgi:tRNA G46 methylase TrmB
MHANSRPVTSNQADVHEELSSVVTRYATTVFKKPIAEVNRQAFEQAIARWRAAGCQPLIIDAGCGVGLSTLNLAKTFSQSFVIGIDQSADRLARRIEWLGAAPPNCLRIRADLVDFWRLLLEAGIHPAQHYLLYPNPWPKKPHLGRRWHGHPVFPAIVALGGLIECRSNWKIYTDEFAAALQQLSGQAVVSESYEVAAADEAAADLPPSMTPFEEKYRASGHSLWRCRAQLPPQTTEASIPTF